VQLALAVFWCYLCYVRGGGGWRTLGDWISVLGTLLGITMGGLCVWLSLDKARENEGIVSVLSRAPFPPLAAASLSFFTVFLAHAATQWREMGYSFFLPLSSHIPKSHWRWHNFSSMSTLFLALLSLLCYSAAWAWAPPLSPCPPASSSSTALTLLTTVQPYLGLIASAGIVMVLASSAACLSYLARGFVNTECAVLQGVSLLVYLVTGACLSVAAVSSGSKSSISLAFTVGICLATPPCVICFLLFIICAASPFRVYPPPPPSPGPTRQ